MVKLVLKTWFLIRIFLVSLVGNEYVELRIYFFRSLFRRMNIGKWIIFLSDNEAY